MKDGPRHGVSGHKEYNKRVGQLTKDYINKTGVNPSGLTAKEAKKFGQGLLNEIQNAEDAYIRGFNSQVRSGKTQRQIQKWAKGYRREEQTALRATQKAAGGGSGKLVKTMRAGGKVLKVVAIGTFVYYVNEGRVAYAAEQSARDFVFADEITYLGDKYVSEPWDNAVGRGRSNRAESTQRLKRLYL